MSAQPLIEPDAVREQTARILASPEFQKSIQLQQFLRYVVEETLAGRGDQIKQYTVAVKAFGRPSSFNPRADPIVRTEARRLRRRLARYYRSYGPHDPIIIDIPTGAYIPTFRLNGQHKQRTAVAPTSDSPLSRLPSSPAILVLPFETHLDGAEQRFFADGLAEQLAIALNRFAHLLVIGPLRRAFLKEHSISPRALARRYEAQFVLAGGGYEFEDKIKITVRLMDGASGRLLWSDAYNGQTSAADLFLFGEEATNRIAATLADIYGIILRTLTRRAMHTQTDDFRVYDAVLRYTHYMITGTDQAAAEAMRALEQAAKLDPSNAVIKAMLADFHAIMYQYGDDTALEQSERLARESVLLDPQCQHAHFVLAFSPFFKGERDHFIHEMKHAVSLNPNNAMVLAVAGLHLGTVGEWEEGKALMKKAMILNPHSPGWYHSLALLDAYRQGRFQEALVAANKFNRPGLFWDPLLRAAVLGQLGRKEKASAALQELLALRPDFPRRGRALMYRALFSDENVEMLLDGLYKAGLGRVA